MTREPTATTLYCQQAKELLEALTDAIHDLVTLHQEQFQAVIGGDLGSTRFDHLIHKANLRKAEAKDAYMSHLGSHRCSVYALTDENTSKAADA